MLPQFIDPQLPIARQILIFGITNTVLEFGVQLGYAVATGRAASLVR